MEIQLLENEAEQNPEDLGRSQLIDGTFYSHSINKDPA